MKYFLFVPTSVATKHVVRVFSNCTIQIHVDLRKHRNFYYIFLIIYVFNYHTITPSHSLTKDLLLHQTLCHTPIDIYL